MQALSVNDFLRQHIRTVPDWPAPGVQFRDITPLLQDPKVFRVLIDAFVHRYMDKTVRPDVVAGLDARGFILGAVVAYELNVGFIPIRKKGKLPFTTVAETYELEYGSATVELSVRNIAVNWCKTWRSSGSSFRVTVQVMSKKSIANLGDRQTDETESY